MSLKPKVLFIYSMEQGKPWMDGLWAALNLLEDDFNLERWNMKTGEGKGDNHDYHELDFVLGWGAFGSPVDEYIREQVSGVPSGLCIAGVGEFQDGYDAYFYETEWYKEAHIPEGVYAVHAFGTNTELYAEPDMAWPVINDYLGVGALADWKRWDLMGKKEGRRMVIGHYQKGNEQESLRIARNLLVDGVMVSPEKEPLELLSYYWTAQRVYIPANIVGGGERAVLEARACGCEVVVEDDNPKLGELITSPIFDHNYYAKQLRKGIGEVIKNVS